MPDGACSASIEEDAEDRDNFIGEHFLIDEADSDEDSECDNEGRRRMLEAGFEPCPHRDPRHAQRGSLLDTHTYQQARAPLSLPSRASCASSAIATANSSSHRATSTVGVRFFPSSSSVSAAPPCRLFRRPRLQAHALLPTAHLAMLLPRRRCLFSYAAAPAPIRASPSSFSRRTTCESRRHAFTFLGVLSKWWLLPPRCARAAAARARRVITGVPTANHAVPP